MTRLYTALGVLGMILVVVLFWLFLLQPQQQDLADTREAITDEQDTQSRLTAAINRLLQARDQAPELEAEIAAAEAIVTDGAQLPALLRQLQLAADESQITLQNVSTGRPSPVPDTVEDGLSEVSLNLQVVGHYFAVVDFLRRIEDPRITARGVLWDTISLSRADYPQLNVSLSGSVFAVITEPAPPEGEPADPAPEADPEADPEDGPGADPDEADPGDPETGDADPGTPEGEDPDPAAPDEDAEVAP